MGRTMPYASLFFLTIDSSFFVSSRSRSGKWKDFWVFQERASRAILATGTTPFGPMGVGSSDVDSTISGLTLESSRSRRGNRKDLSVFQERASREILATGSSGVDSTISGLTWEKSNRSTSPVVLSSGLGRRKKLIGQSSYSSCAFL
jgi:hypothetical protein